MKIITTFVATKGNDEFLVAEKNKIKIYLPESDALSVWSVGNGDKIQSGDEYRPIFREVSGNLRECMSKIIFEAYHIAFQAENGRPAEKKEDFEELNSILQSGVSGLSL